MAYIALKTEKIQSIKIRSFIFGASSGSIAMLIMAPIFLIIYSESTIDTYRTAMVHNYALFGILVIYAVVLEGMQWIGVKSSNFFDNKIPYAFIFGFGWTISEFVNRFLFFFNNGNTILYSTILFVYLLIVNIAFSSELIRAMENTKFVIYCVFLKLSLELGFYGALGLSSSLNDGLMALGGAIIVQVILISLSLFVRKYPMKD